MKSIIKRYNNNRLAYPIGLKGIAVGRGDTRKAALGTLSDESIEALAFAPLGL